MSVDIDTDSLLSDYVVALPPDSTDPIKRMTTRERRALLRWGWSTDVVGQHSIWWLMEKESLSQSDAEDVISRLMELDLLDSTLYTPLFRRTPLGDETALRMMRARQRAEDSVSDSRFRLGASMLLVGMILGLGLAMFWVVQ